MTNLIRVLQLIKPHLNYTYEKKEKSFMNRQFKNSRKMLYLYVIMSHGIKLAIIFDINKRLPSQ